MPAMQDLDQLLKGLCPDMQRDEFVFCTVSGALTDYLDLAPVACFQEVEGLSLVLPLSRAEAASLTYEGPFKMISLTVHSSLDAVGLTAAVSTVLARAGISANVVAAFYHDHIFVPSAQADCALAALQSLSQQTHVKAWKTL